jgi:hypothetical protein
MPAGPAPTIATRFFFLGILLFYAYYYSIGLETNLEVRLELLTVPVVNMLVMRDHDINFRDRRSSRFDLRSTRSVLDRSIK